MLPGPPSHDSAPSFSLNLYLLAYLRFLRTAQSISSLIVIMLFAKLHALPCRSCLECCSWRPEGEEAGTSRYLSLGNWEVEKLVPPSHPCTAWGNTSPAAEALQLNRDAIRLPCVLCDVVIEPIVGISLPSSAHRGMG